MTLEKSIKATGKDNITAKEERKIFSYQEYLESIKDIKPSEKFEFKIAVLWLNKRHLPMGLISLGDPEIEKIRVPAFVENEYGITVPVTAVSRLAFENNAKITDVILPASIDRFPKCLFSGCSSLNNVTIPRKIKKINEETFKGCVNLENIFYEGTPEEWANIKIVHEKHEVELGDLVPGTPIQTIIAERLVNIPGNEAIFSANIHFRCKL